MAFHDHVLRLIHFGRLSERNPTVGSPRDPSQTKPFERWHVVRHNALFRRGIGLALLLFGAAFAFTAHQASQKWGVESWLAENPPTRALTHTLLHARGFTVAHFGDDPRGRTARKSLRKLPEASDSVMRVWSAVDSNWTAVFWPAPAGEPLELWCRHCEQPAEGFINQGASWVGLAQWAQFAEKNPLNRPNGNPTSHKSDHAWSHPKEVRVWR